MTENKKIRTLLLKVSVFIIGIFFLPFFILPMTVGIIHTGTVVGTIACIVLMAFSLFTDKIISAIKFLWKNIFMKIIFSAMALFVSLGVIFVLAMSFFMIFSAGDKPDGTEDAVVVLGCKVNGESPSIMLRKRIEKAYEYSVENPDVIIIASGGKGIDEGISEAECIKRELISMGVDEKRILTEDKSTDTYENLENTLSLIGKENPEIAIVTDGFHQFRAGLICDDMGIEKTSLSAKTPLFLLPSYIVREWFGLAEQIFLK